MKRAALFLLAVLSVSCAESISVTIQQVAARYPPSIRQASFEEKLDAVLAIDKALTVREMDFVFGEGKQVVKGSDVAAALFLPAWQVAKRNLISVPACAKGQTTNCPTEEMRKRDFGWAIGQHKIGAIALEQTSGDTNRGNMVIYQLFVDGEERDLKTRRLGSGIL